MMGIAGREGSHLDRFVRHPSPKTAMGYPLSRLPCFRYSGRSLNLLTAPPNKRTIRCVSPLRRAVFAKSTPAEARPRFRGQLFRVRYTFLVRCPKFSGRHRETPTGTYRQGTWISISFRTAMFRDVTSFAQPPRSEDSSFETPIKDKAAFRLRGLI